MRIQEFGMPSLQGQRKCGVMDPRQMEESGVCGHGRISCLVDQGRAGSKRDLPGRVDADGWF